MMPGYYGTMGWPMFFTMLLTTLFWFALIGLLVFAAWAVLRRVPATTPTPHEPTALESLARRYARGEIDAATYEEIRARIEGTREGTRPEHPPLPVEH